MAKDQNNEFPEIEDDLPVDRAGAKTDVAITIDAPEGDPAAHASGDAVEEGVEVLKAQLAAERAARAQDRAAKVQTDQELAQTRVSARDSHHIAITNSIELTKTKLDNIEASLAAAMEGADYKTVAKLQREIASEQSKLDQLENGRVAIEEQIQRGKEQPKVEQRQPQQQRVLSVDEQAEAFAARLEQQGTPASAQWLRAHKGVMARPQKLAAADEDAKFSGIAPETPEYFAHIEKFLGLGQQQRSAPAAQQRRPAIVAAPSNRDATSLATGRPTNSRVINLTLRQQEMAAAMEMTNEEYAKFYYEEMQSRGATH